MSWRKKGLEMVISKDTTKHDKKIQSWLELNKKKHEKEAGQRWVSYTINR